tara:strand:- start:4465 stop:5358 length:894 start_codon:yes stop_codon:yes gene_type:complete
MNSVFYLVTLLCVLSTSVYSQECDVRDAEFSQAGYFLGNYQQRLLLKESVLPRNTVKTKADKVQSVQKSIEATWGGKKVPELTSIELAELVVDVASSVGIDFQILASILKKESLYCINRFNRRGGDSGCMQFTTPAITEMKHQLGFSGEGKYTPGTPELLAQLASRFFKDDSQVKTGAYLKWLSKSISDIKTDLRRGSNFQYDILTGAIYLKLYLSVSNGNYVVAVRNYNGSKRKFAYQSSVMVNATKISQSEDQNFNWNCYDNEKFSEDVHKLACQFEEDYESCFTSYFRSLPGYL